MYVMYVTYEFYLLSSKQQDVTSDYFCINIMPTPLHANASVLIRYRVKAMAYKRTETDVLYGVEMVWMADATAHGLLTPRGFTF
jgi:hypothetical protein